MEGKTMDKALITAAPEMLAALKGVRFLLNSTLMEYLDEPWAKAVFAAIAKAEGR